VANMLSYTKILVLGAQGTERALMGDVIVQEKVDGSQFRWGVDADGRARFGSHHNELFVENPDKTFAPAVTHIVSIPHRIPSGWWFYAEYLKQPKQNTLAYGRIPRNHLALFDVWMGDDGWANRQALIELADAFEIDVVPELHRGPITAEGLKALLVTPSFLGNEIIEGVVIKNYHELVALGGRTYPLFTKLVREQFSERHKREWKQNSGKSKLDNYLESFQSEARWRKAVQHLAEKGELENGPRDIGKIMRAIAEDIRDEERENIMAELYDMHIGDICRSAQRGAAEWYKAQLLERVAE
jgi:hypothetical protein